ncbi:hypothetical protein GTC6_05502 [Gordonia terrae C-6]|uniref:Uncharacterized protein n=1 Tax=Gordonia terrae C-6 TaxID=1316928 RepID=R7YCU5_9ACTN|nr:hypothetical protein [Gordonia terrae]EON33797.1 hypothetical protein GTC6_05502 [Gordonia terrae C-6]
MGLVSRRVSDVSGEELDEGTYVNIVVKNHSKLDESKQIDVSAVEAKSIKTVNGLVELEFRPADGPSVTVFATETELNKVVPVEVLQRADGTRGRRRGWTPSSGQ